MKGYNVVVNMICKGPEHRMGRTISDVEMDNLKKSTSFKIISAEEVNDFREPGIRISKHCVWFDTFFEEKNLMSKAFTVETDKYTHLVDSEFVIELIKSAPNREQAQIKDQLVKIDFHNGDVLHYLEFLAKAYIKTQYGE